MIEELNKKEKEYNNNKNKFMNNKRKNEEIYYSNMNKEKIPKNKYYLKVQFKGNIQMDFSEEIIKEYFKKFGSIEKIYLNKKEQIGYIKFKYNDLIDKIIKNIYNNKEVDKLFNIKKEKLEGELQNENLFSRDEIKEKIQNEKILNDTADNGKRSIDFKSISLENFENEIFK